MKKFAKIIGSNSKGKCNQFKGAGCVLSENFRKVEMLDSEYFVSALTVASLVETEEMDRAFFVSGDELDFAVEGFGLDFQ